VSSQLTHATTTTSTSIPAHCTWHWASEKLISPSWPNDPTSVVEVVVLTLREETGKLIAKETIHDQQWQSKSTL
jgi:hypothetical protein